MQVWFLCVLKYVVRYGVKTKQKEKNTSVNHLGGEFSLVLLDLFLFVVCRLRFGLGRFRRHVHHHPSPTVSAWHGLPSSRHEGRIIVASFSIACAGDNTHDRLHHLLFDVM